MFIMLLNEPIEFTVLCNTHVITLSKTYIIRLRYFRTYTYLMPSAKVCTHKVSLCNI